MKRKITVTVKKTKEQRIWIDHDGLVTSCDSAGSAAKLASKISGVAVNEGHVKLAVRYQYKICGIGFGHSRPDPAAPKEKRRPLLRIRTGTDYRWII